MRVEMDKEHSRKGFTLAELLIVVAIIGILVAVSIPIFTAQLHKAAVATDWANLRAYYSEIQADFIATGKYNPEVEKYTVESSTDNYYLDEIHFLDGQTVKIKSGNFMIRAPKNKDGTPTTGGYQIVYWCNKYFTDYETHSRTCYKVFGGNG